MKKRLLSLLLCLCMALTLLPVTAWASHGLSIIQQPGLPNDYTVEVNYTGTEPVSYQWYRWVETPDSYTVVAENPGQWELAAEQISNGAYADGSWTMGADGGEYRLYLRYPPMPDDRVTVTVPSADASQVSGGFLLGDSLEGETGVYTATYTYSNSIDISASAALTATVTVERFFTPLDGQTAPKLADPVKGETYLCVVTAPDGSGGISTIMSEQVTVQDPVARVSWRSAGVDETRGLSADDLNRFDWVMSLADMSSGALCSDAATVTLLEDVVLTDSMFLSMVNATLDGGGHTLTKNFGGGYLGDPMLSCGILHDNSPAAHTLTHVTVDGTYCGKEQATAPPAVVDVGKNSTLTLGEGTAIINGGQPPASQPDCFIPDKGGAIDVASGGTLRLEPGSSITGNRGQQAGGVCAEAGSRVELSGAVEITGNTKDGQPSNLVLRTTEERSTDASSFVPIQITASVAGGRIGVSRLAYDAAKYTYVTSPGVVAQGDGHTLDQDDLAAFFSDDPAYAPALDVENNAIVLGDPPPHVHAMSVGCEAQGEGLLTFDKPLTVNSDGELCVDGEALITNSYGYYTLGGGNYYLAGDIALDNIIIIQDAAGAPTNLCLNGHTLDLGEERVVIRGTAGGKGVLNLCDCGGEGKVTSAYSTNFTHSAATIEVSDQFSLYGGTVENTAPSSGGYKNAVAQMGAISLYGGKLVCLNGNGLYLYGYEDGGVTLWRDVTIQGGKGQADILFYPADHAPITLAEPMTKPATPWRVAVENGTPMPLVTGWATHMGEADFTDYFQSADKGQFITQLENKDLALDICAITQQPSAENSYTVAANGAPASVPTYQWYPATMVTVDITSENAATYEGEDSGACYQPSAFADGKWTASEGTDVHDPGYFTLALKRGDRVAVTLATKDKPSEGQLGLVRDFDEPGEYVQVWYPFGSGGGSHTYVATAVEDGDNTVITYVIPADGTYDLRIDGMYGSDQGAPPISAALTSAQPGAALTGQTDPELNTTDLGGGLYLCRVTWPDGATRDSDTVTYTLPHKHAVSVGCEATGEDQVTFDKALTMNSEGKLCVNGEVVPMADHNDLCFLKDGHYYLAGDVTASDYILCIDGNADLCLNGHTLDVGDGGVMMSRTTSNRVQVCDCSAEETGVIVGDNNFLVIQVAGSSFALYGGTVKNVGQGKNAWAIATGGGGTLILYGGQVVSEHSYPLLYDYSANALTLYDGVTLQGGADMAEVYLSDVGGEVGTEGTTASVITIAEPLTAPETPWRVSAFQNQVFTDGWATHMTGADFGDYFTCPDKGRCVEKTDSGELALANYAITAQPSKANGYTVTANGAPSYRWHSVAVKALTDENATDGGYQSVYADGKWTAGRDAFGELGYFVVDLRKGDILTVTVEDGPIFSADGLCLIPSASGDEIYQSFQSGKTVYTFTAPYDFPYALEYRSDEGHSAPVLSATVTTPGAAVSGQTANKLTAAPEGDYFCRVTWPDGTTLDSDVVHIPHSHAWGKWTLQADKKTLTRTCVGNAEHTESQTLLYALPNNPIVYDAAEKKPAPSLKTDGDIGALREGTDYTVAYADNVNAGTGTVTVTGAGDFSFTLEMTFTIQKAEQFAPTGIFTVTDVAYGQTQGAIAVAGNPSNLEYRLKPEGDSDPDWTAAAASNPLPAGTYEFRYKATANYNASPATSVQVRVVTPDAKRLTIAQGIEHGTVTKRRELVNPGDTVTLAVQPDEGYVLATLTATYGQGQTITPTVKPDNPQQYTFTMPDADVTVTATFAPVPPEGDVTGEVEVKPGTPDVAVDEDALKDLAGEVAEGETVTVKLTVEKQEAPADQAELEEVITGQKDDVLYLDLSLLKRVNDGEAEAITNAAQVLEIAVDYDFTGKKDVTVYRKHGEGKAEKLTRLTARPAKDFADGTFFADSAGGKVYIYASKFSTYAIGYTKQSSTATSRPTSGRQPTRGEETKLPFVDVAATDPFFEAVKYVFENKLMVGTSETTFEPQGQLTRAMLAAILYRQAGSPQVEGAPEFTDTLADTWYSDAIVWAAQTQVLRGYGNGQFGPEDPVSKEMMNMVTARQAGEDPQWVGDPALAAPATRAEIAQVLAEQSAKTR